MGDTARTQRGNAFDHDLDEIGRRHQAAHDRQAQAEAAASQPTPPSQNEEGATLHLVQTGDELVDRRTSEVLD